MSENTAPKAVAPKAPATKGPEENAPKGEAKSVPATTPTPTAPSAEEIAKRIEALPEPLKSTMIALNKSIADHNANVVKLQAAEKSDTTVIKAEIFEQSKDPQLKAMYAEYVKMCEALEKLKDQAYAHIDKAGLMPKDLTEDEITKLKNETQESLKDIKAKSQSFATFEQMAPEYKLSELISEVKTRRGQSSGTKATGKETGIRRPRFKLIEINNVTEDSAGNTVYGLNGEEKKFTFGFASQYLRKQHKGITWSSNDLQDKYYEGEDENNLPDVKTFDMTHSYKDDNGNEQTITYKVKAYRNA